MAENAFSVELIPAEYWIGGGDGFDPAEANVYIDFIQFERWSEDDDSQQDIALVDQGGVTDAGSDGTPSIHGATSIHRVDLYQDGVECEWEELGEGNFAVKIGGTVGVMTEDPAIIEELRSLIDPDVPAEFGPDYILEFNLRKTGDDPPITVESEIECSGTLTGIDPDWGP
ncbi:MAG: hypothetical protein CMJ36_00370 [Phycisphaerae bacterium]|nr:hypothetical protein [Phycisphaerae bacterium]